MAKWIIIAVVLVVIWVIYSYNKLIKLKIQAENGWSQIDTQLQRRYDLIPNLVETVKGYAEHEMEIFDKVTKARAGLDAATTVADKAQADSVLSDSVKSIFAVAENYPTLKANENFKELQVELAGTENKIAYARQFYNDTVSELNQATEMFPTNVIAKLFGIMAREFFESKQEAAEPVKVDF